MAPARRDRKARPNPLHEARITYIDYKDTNLLRKFISDRGKIRSRRVTLPQPSAGGAPTTAQQQNAMARAIKNAREMALLPYVSGAPTAVKAGR
ncbi:30S ribosomal protein S18 [Kitasatospora sp. RB6PN24]|uniref:30S ribosomal protein S18 n=1 Tax=Kitasatospora humi TaxID=2893891 RepID=UPI001E39EB52|nr:30S ribosomal protein S18 [Kitasatospora humi]MCC9311553.1 30S ribosomal protein S18 [Kitasatospora humi]